VPVPLELARILWRQSVLLFGEAVEKLVVKTVVVLWNFVR